MCGGQRSRCRPAQLWLQEQPYGSETLLMMFDRWRKLERALYVAKEKAFDISKIPDVYDSIKYDCIHNKHLGFDLSRVRPPPGSPPCASGTVTTSFPGHHDAVSLRALQRGRVAREVGL